MVERIGRRHRADQDEHDQAHTLLAVVGAVEKADAGAGQYEEPADPVWRRRRALWCAVKFGEGQNELRGLQQDRGEDEPHQGRERQGAEDIVPCDRLSPIVASSGAAVVPMWYLDCIRNKVTQLRY